jgi:hypothetical protein
MEKEELIMEKKSVSVPWIVLGILFAISLGGSKLVGAHCDTLDGRGTVERGKEAQRGASHKY